jgi:succinoglycan biosynthesis transport protein ExoP
MPEVLDEQSSEPLDMQRYLDVARRRYPSFLLIGIFGWLGLGSKLDSTGKL